MSQAESEATTSTGVASGTPDDDHETTPGAAGDEPAGLYILELMAKTWELFRAQPLTYVAAAAILIAGGVLTFGILLAPLAVGFITMTSRHLRGEEIEAGQILEGMQNFGHALVAGVLIGAGVAAGTVALVIPGAVLAVLWSFTLHFVALEKQSALGAMGASWRLCRRHVGSVLLVLLTSVALSFLGSLVVVGVLISTPLALILLTFSFNELRH